MMAMVYHRRAVHHQIVHLPPINCVIGPEPMTIGGRWVRRRTGLSPQIANTIAELAGLGPRQSK